MKKKGGGEPCRRVFFSVFALLLALTCAPAAAEYGDVVLNKRAGKEEMRPVIFPHWFHRIRFRCKVCHSELGFEMSVGANNVLMSDIIDGKFCGMCHNDKIAWGPENCDLCHSGKPDQKIRVQGGGQPKGRGDGEDFDDPRNLSWTGRIA